MFKSAHTEVGGGGTANAEKLSAPLVGAQGYQTSPLSKPVVGRNIALHAVAAYRAFIPTYFLPSRFIQISFPLHFFNPQGWNVYWI